LSFNATANLVYTWLANGQALNTINDTLVVSESGLYALALVNNTLACSDTTDAIQIVENNYPDITITASGPLGFCLGDDLTLSAANADTYLWSTGDTTQNITVNTAATVSLLLSSNGCEAASDTLSIVTFELPTVSAGNDTTICENFLPLTIVGQASSSQVLWSTGANTLSTEITQAGIYSLTATSTEGCIAIDSVSISTDPCVGIEENELFYTIYPNPVSHSLVIESNQMIQHASILSAEGKIIFEIRPTSGLVQMDLSALSSGIYLLHFSSNNGLYTERIIKQ
jgi:hypothetical protein